jgi:hypothetical protein
MRQPNEITNWIIDCIGHVYKAPGMYGGSQAALDAVLWILHSVWAHVVDRERDFRRENLALRRPTSPPGFHNAVTNDADLDVVIRHWRGVDERLGLVIPVAPQKSA